MRKSFVQSHGFWWRRAACLILAAGLIAIGVTQLVAEIKSGYRIDDPQNGFRNARGFAAEHRNRILRDVMASGRPAAIRQEVLAQLPKAPFDPFLLSLLSAAEAAEMTGAARHDRPIAGDLVTIAQRLDQAARIAPHDRRIAQLREISLHLLTSSRSGSARRAEQGQAVP